MGKVIKIGASLTMFLIFFNVVSALSITLNPNSISETLNQGASKDISIDYSITNPDNATVPAILNLGNFYTGFLSSSNSNISVPPLSSSTGTLIIHISANSTVAPKIYSGSIFLQSVLIPVTLDIRASATSQNSTGNCKVYILPIPLSKYLESGTTATQSIDVYVSKYCASALTINTNQPQMIKPIKFDAVSGLVEPSGKFTIPISYDTNDVSTGTYSDNIIISAIDDNENQYSLTIPISLTVSNLITPITNSSSIAVPSCSLTATEFNYNQTYKLICQNKNQNVEVVPDIDPFFLVGNYPYVEETQNSYSYTMKAINLGTTAVKAKFLYHNAPMESSFKQQVNILAGGLYIPSAVLKAKFYPELYQATDGKVTVRILDNATGAILDDSTLYLDGIIVNNSLSLDPNKEYELRANHAGYMPLVMTVNPAPKVINFTLNAKYYLGDSLNFATIPANATILYDNKIITMPFTLTEEGAHTISAYFLGYTTTTKNFTVLNIARIITSTISDDAKKGESIFLTVDRNDSNLRVTYKKDSSSPEVFLNQTIGSTISAYAEEAGDYQIFADNTMLKSYTIENNPFYTSWWFLGGGAIGFIFLIIYFSRRSSSNVVPSQGLSMTVGGGNYG